MDTTWIRTASIIAVDGLFAAGSIWIAHRIGFRAGIEAGRSYVRTQMARSVMMMAVGKCKSRTSGDIVNRAADLFDQSGITPESRVFAEKAVRDIAARVPTDGSERAAYLMGVSAAIYGASDGIVTTGDDESEEM